ncbi:MAG: hypothetical protein QOJ50_272 [Cryptosporangiaceae bacterium]|nr:hypothetical protein [Cryptosporangiaceae bacterium]
MRKLSDRVLIRLAVGATVSVAVAAAGIATVAAATPAGPSARGPQPATPAPAEAADIPDVTSTTTIRIGDLSRPAARATAIAGLPRNVPLADESAAEGARPTATTRSARVTIPSTKRFSAVGVSWAADPATGSVTVAVRTLAPNRTGWSTWFTSGDEADPLDGPSEAAHRPGTVRGGSGTIWTAPSTGVDVVVTSLAGAAPRDVKVDLIDPGQLSSDAAAAAPAGPRRASRYAKRRVGSPVIYPRSSWGASQRLMTWAPEYAPQLLAAVLHHTATTNSYRPQDVPAILRSIYHFQAVTRGWGDIGYNVIVDKFGRAWEGRYGGIGRVLIGAHAGGFNAGTTGIAMLGNFTNAKPTSAQLEMVARYMAWKFAWAGIWAPGRVWITGGPSTKYSKRVRIIVTRLYGHRLTSSTACPGKYGVAAMPWLVQRVNAIVSHAAVWVPPAPRPPAPAPRPSPTA